MSDSLNNARFPLVGNDALAVRVKQVQASGMFDADYGDRIPSPCVARCKMNEDRSHCVGCYRTIDDIRAWGNAEDAERLQIWQGLLNRAGLDEHGEQTRALASVESVALVAAPVTTVQSTDS